MEVKTQVANLALARLGNKGSVENLDEPKKQVEIVCSKWWDVSRKTALRYMMPSFARKREIWAQDESYQPAFGYTKAYLVRSDCLKVLGIGDLNEKTNDYAVEDNHILTNDLYQEGLPVRFVADVKDVAKFTPDFIELFSWVLARDIAPELEYSTEQFQLIEKILPEKIMEYCGVDAQENKPIRVSHSRLQLARLGLWPFGENKY